MKEPGASTREIAQDASRRFRSKGREGVSEDAEARLTSAVEHAYRASWTRDLPSPEGQLGQAVSRAAGEGWTTAMYERPPIPARVRAIARGIGEGRAGEPEGIDWAWDLAKMCERADEETREMIAREQGEAGRETLKVVAGAIERIGWEAIEAFAKEPIETGAGEDPVLRTIAEDAAKLVEERERIRKMLQVLGTRP